LTKDDETKGPWRGKAEEYTEDLKKKNREGCSTATKYQRKVDSSTMLKNYGNE